MSINTKLRTVVYVVEHLSPTYVLLITVLKLYVPMCILKNLSWQ